MTRVFGRRIQTLLLSTSLLFLMVVTPGCQLGRTWFQMDSNSPMPFFGFDLLPRRASLDQPGQDQVKTLAKSSRSTPVQSVEHRQARELNLPKLSELLQREKSERLSFEVSETR